MKYKLAFVKQDVYADLYFAKQGDQHFYMTSLQRSGPLALFTEYESDFFIVDSDETSDIWKEKVTCCGHKSFDGWNEVRNKQYKSKDLSFISQRDLTTSLSSINFNKYDIVIAVDACLGKEVIEKFNRPLWAYYISEPCMDAYKISKNRMIDGYDVFLNQMFRPENHPEYTLDINSNEIDFPYAFSYPWIYHKIFGFEKNDDLMSCKKLRVVIPGYVTKLLSQGQLKLLKQKYEIITPSGNLRNFLKMLTNGHIYLRLGNHAKFGNETIEAVCAGNLFMSSTKGWKNRIFNIEGTTIEGILLDDQQFEDAISKLDYLNINRSEIERLAEIQRKIACELAFERPRDYLNKHLEDKINV